MTGQLAEIVLRLTAVIEEENRILAEEREKSLESLIQKKSQLLLELLRLQRAMGDGAQGHVLKQLRSLKAAIEANQRLLSIHLSAAREISDTILEALRQNESDGTYESRSGACAAP